MPRTKIVCTIGPASRSPETLEQLIRTGMDVGRLNFSHGTQAEHLITATHMVRSMQDSPRPTHAEVTDVVTMMAAIFADAESSFPFDAWINFRKGWRNVLPVIGT